MTNTVGILVARGCRCILQGGQKICGHN